LQLTECYEKYTLLADADHLTQAEQRASGLSAEIHRLQEWRDHCMPAFTEHPLLFQKNKGSDRMMEAVFQMDSANPSKLLQESLLELQYYDVMIGFHRPFICFPNRSLIPQRSPQADKHATTALELAMASVNLTHCVMSASDVFHGRSDIYQWLWNSVLTIIGFLLAHPLCEHSSSATRHIQLASEMFDAAKKRSIVATRAAALTSFLASKVSSLVEIVKSSSSPISAGTGQGTGQGTGAGGTSEGEHMLNKSSEYEYLGWAHSMSDPETWACTTRKLQGF
jgi:hypothetical protein